MKRIKAVNGPVSSKWRVLASTVGRYRVRGVIEILNAV